jgi:hypothetical protein
MKRKLCLFCCLAAAVLFGADAGAAPLYVQSFETDDTANWTVNSGPSVNTADFYFDYSTLGIPAAPSGSGTRGLKLQANLNPNIANGLTGPASSSSPNGTYAAGGVLGGLSVSPTGKNFGSTYTLKFDWWGNYNGPVNGGGSGTTQLSSFGVGTSGTTPQWIGGTQDSIWFGATLDGGSSSDWRAYSPTAPTRYTDTSAGIYAAGSAAGSTNPSATNTYYNSFGGVSAPAGQLASYPLQTGTSLVGSSAFAWHQVEIVKATDLVSWYVDGLLIANVPAGDDTAATGDNIFFGHADTNNGSSTDETHPQLLFTLIDNVSVGVVPEPTSLSLLGLSVLGLLIRGRR